MRTRRQMKVCGFEQFEPTVVNEDNQAAKRLREDVVESTRTRHWDAQRVPSDQRGIREGNYSSDIRWHYSERSRCTDQSSQ